MFSRRKFLAQSSATLSSAALGSASLATAFPRVMGAEETGERKKVAFLGTVVFRHSHAQHFLDRHCMGYTWGGRWQSPRFDVASVYGKGV